jgi:hypothetical protein
MRKPANRGGPTENSSRCYKLDVMSTYQYTPQVIPTSLREPALSLSKGESHEAEQIQRDSLGGPRNRGSDRFFVDRMPPDIHGEASATVIHSVRIVH